MTSALHFFHGSVATRLSRPTKHRSSPPSARAVGAGHEPGAPEEAGGVPGVLPRARAIEMQAAPRAPPPPRRCGQRASNTNREDRVGGTGYGVRGIGCRGLGALPDRRGFPVNIYYNVLVDILPCSTLRGPRPARVRPRGSSRSRRARDFERVCRASRRWRGWKGGRGSRQEAFPLCGPHRRLVRAAARARALRRCARLSAPRRDASVRRFRQITSTRNMFPGPRRDCALGLDPSSRTKILKGRVYNDTGSYGYGRVQQDTEAWDTTTRYLNDMLWYTKRWHHMT